ncbi:MAG: ATP-binding protein [Candidatus Aenigmarchaeota archaeon]|nr:ATP-binding protein [Candidatus Aenigmarchaeota archaeon]
MKELEEIIKLLNPWWKDGSVSKELAKPYKRRVFNKILDELDYRQIVILSGLRRVGKTTLLYQNIEQLLKKIEPKHILYFNFDKRVKELIEIFNTYSRLTNVNWKKEKIFVFFDEIAKLGAWASKIKLIYDAFPNIKFVVSSSSSIGLEQEAMENLAGRYFLMNIKPLSFVEYLELKGKNRFLENSELWRKEIKKEFESYLLRSFPEIIEWKDELLIKDYLRTTIIDKVIKSDLPEKFENVNNDLLFNLLDIFYTEPGMHLDYDGISKKLRISKKSLIRHIFYLEFSYLLKRIKNFRINTLTSSKKLQRIYPTWWTLSYCYTNNYDKIMENVVASSIDAKYYWRKDGKEIDFLLVKGKKVIPIEVKNKRELTKNELKNMKYFMEKYKIKQGFVIYNGKEREIEINKNKKIKFIPLWKWLLGV